MALQVVSPAVSVFKVTGVVDGVEQTEQHTFHRGELLPEWVTPYQQFVLSQTGMARQVGDFPDPNLKRPEEIPAPVLMPEHDPRAVVGTEVTGPQNVVRVVTGQGGDAGAGSDDGAELPADGDTKPVWEDYAVKRKFLKRGDAESMRKAELVDAVKQRHAAASGTKAEAGDTAQPPLFATGGRVTASTTKADAKPVQVDQAKPGTTKAGQ
jgi:hypothetical protein